MSLSRRRRRRLRDFSCMPWFPPCLGRRTLPLPVSLNRFAAVFLVFILGMTSLPKAAPGRPRFPRIIGEFALVWPAECGERLYGGMSGSCQGQPPSLTSPVHVPLPVPVREDRCSAGDFHERIRERAHRLVRACLGGFQRLPLVHRLADVEVEFDLRLRAARA